MTLAGDCAVTIRSATLWQYVSQSGFAMVKDPVRSGLTETLSTFETKQTRSAHDCILRASITKMAFLMLPFASSIIWVKISSGILSCSR